MQTDSDGFPVDAWGNRLRYVVARHIANPSCSGSTTPTNYYETMFTSKSLLRSYGVSCQPNDLIVCKTATGISGTDCASATDRIMAQSSVVAIVYSTGKNYALNTAGSGIDEAANLNADRVFV